MLKSFNFAQQHFLLAVLNSSPNPVFRAFKTMYVFAKCGFLAKSIKSWYTNPKNGSIEKQRSSFHQFIIGMLLVVFIFSKINPGEGEHNQMRRMYQ